MLISLSEAAELLGYSVSGLRKLVRRREIQYFQAGPHSPLKFRREWLDEFISAGSVAPGESGEPSPPKKRSKPQRAIEPRSGFDSRLLDI
jgi:excisionase family DNA binding protein